MKCPECFRVTNEMYEMIGLRPSFAGENLFVKLRWGVCLFTDMYCSSDSLCQCCWQAMPWLSEPGDGSGSRIRSDHMGASYVLFLIEGVAPLPLVSKC